MSAARRWLPVVLLVVLALPTTRARADRRSLWLHHLHTGEQIRVAPFGRLGRLHRPAWRRLSRLLRSWRTDKRHMIHPRLLRTLAHIQHRMNGRRLDIVSGYRPADDDDAPSSYHHVGRAIDLRVRGVTPRALFELCLTLSAQRPLGCGYYPGRFVHIDVRGAPGRWIDLSDAGQPPRYVSDVRGWLARHPDR